jgi:hypothetical protein
MSPRSTYAFRRGFVIRASRYKTLSDTCNSRSAWCAPSMAARLHGSSPRLVAVESPRLRLSPRLQNWRCGAEIADRAVMADPFDGGGELMVGGNETLKMAFSFSCGWRCPSAHGSAHIQTKAPNLALELPYTNLQFESANLTAQRRPRDVQLPLSGRSR